MRLLVELGADINVKAEGGWTALHLAADGRHEVVVRLLVELGADVNVKDEYGQTALHRAASGS
jgi:ankyrin repeat protein